MIKSFQSNLESIQNAFGDEKYFGKNFPTLYPKITSKIYVQIDLAIWGSLFFGFSYFRDFGFGRYRTSLRFSGCELNQYYGCYFEANDFK